MSRVILEKELGLIRRRLEAIEEVLAEEMSTDDKVSLQEALRGHGAGRSIAFKPTRSRARKH
jgi:hypothetical protein